MKKKELKAKLDRTEFREAVMGIELAHACRSIEKLRGDLATLQLELDTKTDELEALQVATCAEVTELKAQLKSVRQLAHDTELARLAALDGWDAEVAELKAKIAEYEIVLKPVHPRDAERMQQWVPVEDGHIGEGGTHITPMHLFVKGNGKWISLSSEHTGMTFELGDYRICRKVEGAVVGTTNEDVGTQFSTGYIPHPSVVVDGKVVTLTQEMILSGKF